MCAHALSYLKRLFTFQNVGQVLFNLRQAPLRSSFIGKASAEPESQSLARNSAQVGKVTYYSVLEHVGIGFSPMFLRNMLASS